jgi:hypothetical protein
VAVRRKLFSRSHFRAAAVPFSDQFHRPPTVSRACLADWVTMTLSDDTLICSAKGCRVAAAYALRWNNPALHPPERRKTWLACVEHRQSLADFLGARGFLREIDELPVGFDR